MNSEKVTGELPTWIVPVYVVISVCTVATGFVLALWVFGVASRDDFRSYCYHGGAGELMAYAFTVLNFVWPAMALQVLLSFYVAKKLGRLTVVIVTSMLPLVLLVGGAPCW